jgi:putative restriction endonuclease
MSPQGIFKPRLCQLPLSITTVPIEGRRARPYEDTIGTDGFLRYRYRGPAERPVPDHRDNEGLRQAGRLRVPLIYFHGIVPGKYAADYPVYVVGDDRAALTFTVSVDERRFAFLGSITEESPEIDIRRRYATRQVQQRLHQQEFRERVLEAYQRHCAICRLKRDQLLQAAHIVGDREEHGLPRVSNGIALCALHHSAFDAHLLTIRPDYLVEVRADVLAETDGPMLIHGLQGFNEQPIRLPRLKRHHPDRDLLAARYSAFQRAM